MEFVGYCNGSASKSKCAAFDRNLAKKIDIPVTKNGAILTGKTWKKKVLYNGKSLSVIDFDVKKNEKYELSALPKKCRDTYIVRTGSGGLHVYFFVIDDFVNNQSYKNPRSESLKGIDVRGEGGIIFAPGCRFREHPSKYKIISDKEIKEITAETFKKIMNKLLKLKVRDAFKDIYNGKFKITHVSQESTGIPEFEYWAAFYREYLACGYDLDEIIKHFNKNPKIQPEFDEKETRTQIRDMKQDLEKRPSKEYYNKLFPGYIKQKKKNKEIGEVYVEIEHTYNHSPMILSLGEKGILLTIFYKKGIKIDVVAKWDYFKILERFERKDGQIRFNYIFKIFDGGFRNIKENRTLNQLVDDLKVTVNYPKINYYLVELLSEYIKQQGIPLSKYAEILGFTEDGWQMPDRFRFLTKGIQKIQVDGIKEMLSIEYDEKEVKGLMRRLYETVDIEDKNLHFAFYCIAPYLFSQKKYSSLLPYLMILGPPGVGKTSLGSLLSHEYWNHMDRGAITVENIKSDSRLPEYMFSTFPVLFDEINSFSIKFVELIKVVTTSDIRDDKKNVNHDLEKSNILCSPLIFTGNHLSPSFREDEALLRRGFVFEVNKPLGKGDMFREVKKKIKRGIFGKFQYDMTKDFTSEYVAELFDSIDGIDEFTTSQEYIYKTFLAGEKLFHYLWDIDLKIDRSKLELMILGLKKKFGSSIVSFFDEQMRATKKPEEYPRLRYRYSEVLEIKGHYVYRTNNLGDLNKRLIETGEITRRISLIELARKLKSVYPAIEYKTNYVGNNTSEKSLYIPLDYTKIVINEKDILKRYNEIENENS
ncbi:MAG: bifunctional DNA primase/polymerase [Candidatus Helarchaeota archaeon]